MDDCVKLADFGSCRGIYSKQPYTEYISTRWYRAPECLLTDGYYGYKMDLWGVGCVLFEVISLYPLFPGNDELDQITKIHNIIGTPEESLLQKFQKYATHMEFDFPATEGTGILKLLPNASEEVKDLIVKLLVYNPDNRITASQALKHPWFKEIKEQEQMLKQQSAVTTQSVRHNFVDSLSQYSKMSDELAGNSEVLQDKAAEIKNKVTSTLYNGKKTGTNFATDKTMGKTTTKKLPDLHLTYNSAQGETMAGSKATRTVGQTSDSEQEPAYQG